MRILIYQKENKMEYKRVKVKFLENYDGFKQGVVYTLFEDYAKRLELVNVIEFCISS